MWFWYCAIPQGNRLDLVELDLPLENLLDLTFIWALLHLLSTNQVQELWGQDEVPFHRLWNNKKTLDPSIDTSFHPGLVLVLVLVHYRDGMQLSPAPRGGNDSPPTMVPSA